MKKKEYIIALLTKLEPDFPMATGMKILINNASDTSYLIDLFYKICSNSLKEVIDEKNKSQLQKSLKIIEHIKEIEDQNRSQEKEDLNKLEDMINEL